MTFGFFRLPQTIGMALIAALSAGVHCQEVVDSGVLDSSRSQPCLKEFDHSVSMFRTNILSTAEDMIASLTNARR